MLDQTDPYGRKDQFAAVFLQLEMINLKKAVSTTLEPPLAPPLPKLNEGEGVPS